MKTAKRVLTERERTYFTAKSADIETIHFVSNLVNIFCDDGSVISVTAADRRELKYTVGKKIMKVTP